MGKRAFKVAQPEGEFLEFSLDAQVSDVFRCPECRFVVAVFFPYRAAGHGEAAIVEYTEEGVVITEEYLTVILAGASYECARCSWPFVRSETIPESI